MTTATTTGKAKATPILPPPSGPVSLAVRERLAHFEASAATRDRALALYVNDALFGEAARTFSETVASGFGWAEARVLARKEEGEQ